MQDESEELEVKVLLACSGAFRLLPHEALNLRGVERHGVKSVRQSNGQLI